MIENLWRVCQRAVGLKAAKEVCVFFLYKFYSSESEISAERIFCYHAWAI